MENRRVRFYNITMPTGQEKIEPIKIHYIFKFIDGASTAFEVFLDAKTLQCINPIPASLPTWTELNYHKCENCTLNPRQFKHCPVAANIAGMVDAFRDFTSRETAHVTVMTRQRDYVKSTTLQEGISSLLGIYMTTSGCPVMAKLKPLVRYHLPFASLEESVVRVVSMYLLIQYFLMKKGRKSDWDLKKLEIIYDQIRKVNAGISHRLRHAAALDASVSALGTLDYTATLLPVMINDTLNAIESSLSSYLED